MASQHYNVACYWRCSFKGIVHPKMKILSFSHSQVVSNLCEFISPAEHKQLMDPIDFNSTEKILMGPINCLVTNILFLCVFSRRKKFI